MQILDAKKQSQSSQDTESIRKRCRVGTYGCTNLVAIQTEAKSERWSKIRVSAGYMACFGCTSVRLCASSLRNLTVPQEFYSHLSISVERSWWPHIRWCGTGWFQEQDQCLFIVLASRSLFCLLLFSLSFLSFYKNWYCGAVVFGLIVW